MRRWLSALITVLMVSALMATSVAAGGVSTPDEAQSQPNRYEDRFTLWLGTVHPDYVYTKQGVDNSTEEIQCSGYREFYTHYTNDGTPDWVLVSAYTNSHLPWIVCKRYGSRILRTESEDALFTFGVGVYDIQKDTFYDLASANNYIDGFDGAFELLNPGQLIGDADADSVISILDGTCIQQHLAHIRFLPAEMSITNYPIDCGGITSLADYDENGIVDIADVTAIQRHLARLD